MDEKNSLGATLGFRAIPNGLLVDADGKLRFQHLGGFDIRDPETEALVSRFVQTGEIEQSANGVGATPAPLASQGHFARGLGCYQAGDLDGARAIWREGVALEPDNWVLRKQLWAVENPDRFYDDSVDYDWQKEQIKQGR